ncbi:MAG: amino acid ABC transporter substrate-binding protein [Firmicutes bacterium]|nr:amino acid ABC transporter substrate-binding protein [Bacillota bacterium]
MKKLLVMLMALVMVFSLAACGGDNEEALTGWAYIEDKGTLIVGLDDTFAPMGFRDEAGNLVGFDIDLATAVGAKLGVEVIFQPIDWNTKEMELSSKRIDCIWNGMSATPERQESMALTDKYLNNSIVIMSVNGTTINAVEDLAAVKIGTQVDSAALEVMQANEAYPTFTVYEYPTYDEAILDMKAGRVDVIVVDQVLGEYKNAQMDSIMAVSPYNFGDDFYAIGCRVEDTDVAAELTAAIDALIKDGTAATISEKWFGRNIVILEGYDK